MSVTLIGHIEESFVDRALRQEFFQCRFRMLYDLAILISQSWALATVFASRSGR
jgi:hypothetical protein